MARLSSLKLLRYFLFEILSHYVNSPGCAAFSAEVPPFPLLHLLLYLLLLHYLRRRRLQPRRHPMNSRHSPL